jgi:CheY-like chemotaxis protein
MGLSAEDVAVAKILVADDNSNIQKMVGLALKDHGIDVVAVGNGEAAVRKIADVHPDLVLADVFMPVRNGYEVCKFVKEDKALSHIPVILLVGAFDPLDEQEAQRSGADGVLKKPFVPPDPLISMVKSALVRAGVAHAGFSPKSAEPEPAPGVAPPPIPTLKTEPQPFELPEESFVDEVAPRPAALQIDSGTQPVAFGSLLGTEAAEEQVAEVSTAPAAMERDWRSAKEEVDDEEEEDSSSQGSWRRDSGVSESAVEQEEGVGSSPDFKPHRHEAWTPTREKENLTEAAQTLADGTAPRVPDYGQQQPVTPFGNEAWVAAIQSGLDNKLAVAEADAPVVPAAESGTFVERTAEPVTPEALAPEQAASTAETVVRELESTQDESPSVVVVGSTPLDAQRADKTNSWFSTPPNPWEAEAQKASQLASTWDAAVSAPSSDTSARGDVSFASASAPDEIEVVTGSSVSSEIPEVAVESVREEAAQAVEQAEQEAQRIDTPATTAEAVHDVAAHLDMDAIVAKVLARLSPGLLNDATRELLKPVVEAVIREELESRKP